MQISEAWLRELANPAISSAELVAQLTMAGLEIDSITPVAAEFSGVVVGEVLEMEKHPDADKLRVCKVAVGEAEPLQIVCGASNVRVGLKIPAALCGAVLPGDFKIKKSKLRGVESFGMLCSEKELGLAAEAQGLMELAADAPVGVNIRDYLHLNDNILEVDLTPNRADCLSVEGLAREIAALNNMPFTETEFEIAPVSHNEIRSITIDAPEACPRYLGRIIKGVNAKAPTPLWMQERLRRSGQRSIGILIDVTNYVLLELGQPLHVFDNAQLHGDIHVRYPQKTPTFDAPLLLLNGQADLQKHNDVLVIADDVQPLALAGIMGGDYSAVIHEETETRNVTTDVFLECAFFTPTAIAGKARSLGLHTDSSHRFERGVDPFLQQRAIERATQLIVEIAGGSVGVINEVSHAATVPTRPAVALRKQRLAKVLGIELTNETVTNIFQRLGMKVETSAEGWQVTPPGFRFDISIEADLIEEVARIVGYNQLPSTRLLLRSELGKAPEATLTLDRVQDLLVDRGYQEAITYSFVDEEIQQLIAPNDEVVRLQNPISSELSVMRTSLWCGLLRAALYNTNRQQNRVRLFETGLRFVNVDGVMKQEKMLAGLALGSVNAEQWGEKNRKVDFFDMKADIEALSSLIAQDFTYTAAKHPALHPGQSAQISNADGEIVGWVGMLHPTLEKKLGFDNQVFLLELNQDLILKRQVPRFAPLSKFPSVRRDMALIVKEDITANHIMQCIEKTMPEAIKDANEIYQVGIKDDYLPEPVNMMKYHYEWNIFDIYRGTGIEPQHKSVAVSLQLQNLTQTLTDFEIDAIFSRVLDTLTRTIGAKLRD